MPASPLGHRRSKSERSRHRTQQPRAVDLAARAYSELRKMIVTAKLAPGASLIETELSRRLEMSRTPIRGALQRLQQEGFVIGSGEYRRAIVSPLTVEDLHELFLIMGALEGVAARLAAALAPDLRLTLADRMEELNHHLHAATQMRPAQVGHVHDLHIAFHRAYVEAAAGRRLRGELDALEPQYERYERVYVTALIDKFGDSLQEHKAIVAAFRAGDQDAAERHVVANYRNGAERFQSVVTMLGERGNW
jgi:DNA-binding GntR family transcriptional regulator